MLRKLPDKISRFLIYLTAFGVSALMAIMLIHIIKESIPAFSELGIKMFLPSTEWRPVSANPQFGLLPAITGTLYVSFIAVVLALIFGVACACFLNFYLPEKIAAVFLAFIDLVAGIPSVIFGFIGLTVLVKVLPHNFIWQPDKEFSLPRLYWQSCCCHSLSRPVTNLFALHVHNMK